ncbi:MAG: RNA-directed DNA polymerase [Rhodobacterales bacterium]
MFDTKLLKNEWKKRVKAQIRKQLVFDAIEYRDIDLEIDVVIARVQREITSGKYSVMQPKRYLVEKSRGLCRQMTLIYPRDLLVLERLSRSVYFELKDKAPSKSAYFEPDDGNFSRGFKQSDFEYGSFASWKKFQKSVFGFAKENRFIVVTDVANFYDFINFQHLRNIVASLADMRESLLDLLIYMLNRLTWTPDFMPLTQVGMPQIETSATRVLANAMLYEVDKVCEHSTISNYARFMDDMDLGVDSVVAAKRIIRDIDLTLQSRQLRLNSSKTKILTQDEAFEHFCIAENFELNRLDNIVKKKAFSRLVRAILKAKYEKWLSRSPLGGPSESSRFSKGNGSKIHKYVLSLIYEAGGSVDEADLLWLIKNDPSMRSTAFRYLSFSKRNNSNLDIICSMVRRGIFVDDASLADIGGYLLHARFRNTAKCLRLVKEFCVITSQNSDIGLHSAIFVASKYLDKLDLLDLLRSNRDRISGDFWLSRAAAGVAPRFIGEPEWSIYHDFIVSLDSEHAFDVLNYMLKIISAASFNPSLKAYIQAENHTFPQRLYFPKILILLAVSKNPNVNLLAPKLHSQHPALKADPFFLRMGF